jgi:hypothetical protein
MNTANVALTTFDNPYNPFEDFIKWFNFDVLHGYNSCSYLARIAKVSSSLTDEEYNSEVESAIDEIIFNDPFNIYKKIKRDYK